MSIETISATFKKTLYPKSLAATDEDGLLWGIWLVDTKNDGVITCKGKLDPRMCNLDMEFKVVGKWEVYKGKRQFKFHNYSRTAPNGKWGTVAFLMQAPGIGERTAEKVWDEYGEESVSKVINTPAEVTVKLGFKTDVFHRAAEILQPLVAEFRDKIPLMSLFAKTKLSTTVVDKVLSSGMRDPVLRLKENPFMLMQFRGVGFLQCDSLRKKLKLPPDMPERLAAACQQVFINATDQVWLSKKQVSKAIQSLLEVSDLMVVSSIDLLLKKGTIVKNRVGEGEWYGLLRDVEDEEEVARQILSRLNRPGPDWPLEEIANDGMLSPHQKEVVLHNMKNGGRLITLTGSPGVGKTTVLGRIVKYFCDKNDAWPAACAPTGKAAQRLSQSLENSGCSTPATTIHKMLEPVPIDGGWAFKICGHGNYVDADIVAVDEASMLNGWLASHMFRGMHPDTYVILVGDKNQLPPVGPGSMLRDLETLSNFKELTEVRRNAGKIVETCANIRDEKQFTIRPTSSPGVNVTPENNVQMVLAATDSKKSNKVKKLAQSILDGKLDGVKNPIEDVQFMTATHKNSHVGRIVLNKVLQEMFNPKGGGEHKHYRVGDKVIATDNARIKGSENALGMKECVANGEIGYVIESRPKQIVVRMAHDGTELIINCGEDLGNGWDLAYVTTVHKFQGSECPVSITIMGDDFGSHMVMDRSWFYTAISRGKTTSIVIATPDLVRKVVRKNKINDRKSFTLEYMEELKSEIAKMPVDNGV